MLSGFVVNLYSLHVFNVLSQVLEVLVVILSAEILQDLSHLIGLGHIGEPFW